MKMGAIRRIDQHDAALGILSGQGRLQQAKLATAWLAGYDFYQRAERPAAAG